MLLCSLRSFRVLGLQIQTDSRQRSRCVHSTCVVQHSYRDVPKYTGRAPLH